ncbi:cell division protein FtsQ/DivIB [Fructilactobacillus sp. Tb1]|uniref:cell division protein FtsQ/DivIB n=1 Tax=Fructilactobacillus sp. Tb1 TaxID=3422304 RepID=UPI003D2B0B53
MKDIHNSSDAAENDEIENEHLQDYVAKKVKRNSRLRVGRKNKSIRKSRHKQMLKTVLPLSFIFIIIGVIALYFISPLSTVKSVIVNASQNQRQVINALPIKSGDSLMMVKANQTKAINILKARDLNVKSVHIGWKHYNQAVINVKFYDFHAYVKKDKKLFPVNINGVISNKSVKVDNSVNVVVFNGFKKSEQIKACLLQYEKMPSDLKSDVKEIKNEANSDDPQKIRIFLNDKNQIILKSSEMAHKLSYYPSIKTTLKRPSVVNMEYGAYATPIK